MNQRDSVGWWTLAGLAIIAGIAARFVALDAAALAEDEYYLITSVRYILSHGIPTHPQGGYYIRGLIQQYLTAPMLALTGSAELSVRIVPVLASLAAVPAVVLIGRRLGGPAVAALAVALFSLSVWQIEFARFGRMYAPFQTLFLWQCYLLLLVTIDGKRHLWRRMLYISLLGLFVYEGAIFLWAIAVIPLLSGHVRTTARTLIGSGSALAALVGWQMIDFRRLGQPPALPADILLDLEARGGSSSLPVRLPTSTFEVLLDRPGLLLVVAGALMLMAWLITRTRKPEHDVVSTMLMVLVLALAGFGLVGLALVLVILAWLVRPALLTPAGDSAVLRTLLIGGGVATLAWSIALGIAGIGPYGVAKQLLNYPPISQAVVQQWIVTMPRTTLLAVALLSARVAVELRADTRSDTWRMIAATALVAIVMSALIRTGQMSSRYTFFVYATILLLMAESLRVFAGRVSGDVRLRTIASVSGLVAVFVIADDFSLRHLTQIRTPEVMYRVDRPVAVWQHLVPRDDFRSPALFVNERLQDGEIVIAGPPAVPHYLTQHDYSYELYPGIRFFDVVAVEGSRELWTDAQLLWREDALFATLCDAGRATWLVLHDDPRGIRSARDARVRSRLEQWSVFSNFGSTARVYHVPADEWRAAGECTASRPR